MKYQFAVAAFAGSAFASLEAVAPPAYGAEETTTTASTSTTPIAPPAYMPSTTSSSSSATTTSAPVSPVPSSTSYGVDTTVTDLVSTFVTYCPQPTAFTHGGKTYTVTAATTLTVCPKCEETTTTWAVPSSTPVVPETPVAPVPTTSVPPPPPVYSAPPPTTWLTTTQPVPYGYPNSTVPVGPTGTGSVPSGTAPPAYTGAATQLVGGAAAGVVGLFAAFFL